MLRRTVMLVLAAALLVSVASADTKIVKSVHTDGFAVMGQQQPAKDEEHVMWVGKDRMLMDQGDVSFLIRMDQNKLYLVNHAAKAYRPIALPIDLDKLLPPGMGEQMMEMMKFSAKVTPTDEVATIGEWKARRYDVSMTSTMMQMQMQVWATKDVELDLDAYKSMADQIAMMRPGMAEVVEELGKVEGFQVKSEGTMTIMGSDVKTSEKTLSVEELDAPAGTYDLPPEYTSEEFNFMKLQQMQQ